jgi:hypothetical protein
LSPAREGPRPRMPEVLPHVQLDQWPPPLCVTGLVSRAATLGDVIVRQSRMASVETAALAIADKNALGPDEAFIDRPEFCHLHAPPPGGIHLTLPPGVIELLVSLGWGERHPVARTGAISPSLVALYAPRDERETAAAFALVQLSWRFARGET